MKKKSTFNYRELKSISRFLPYTGQMSDYHIVPYWNFPIMLMEYKVFLNPRK